MSGFNSLDLAGRAAALGISCREYVSLAREDRRIVVDPSLDTDGSVARLKRWLSAGSPSADLARLEFGGSDEVRAVVVDVLRRVPVPVAWHAVEHIAWIEVGRHARGWQGAAPVTRSPADDQAHVIVLNGAESDEELAPIAAHELGHSWDRPIQSFGARVVRMSSHEITARFIAVQGGTSNPVSLAEGIERLVRRAVRGEQRADQLATLWGFPRFDDYARIARRFRQEHQAAAELAQQIDRDIERDIEGAA